MCTVSYIPIARGSYILTSNRDESPARPRAEYPGKYLVHGKEVIYPKDPVGGGTWIAASGSGHTLCLLNGAFEKHEWNPPYRLSRGKMLLDFFESGDPEKFISDYDFEGIEPFTLLIIGNSGDFLFHEIRWDEKMIHLSELDQQLPILRSSASLYSKDIIDKKERLFRDWIGGQKDYTPEQIVRFHSDTRIGDPENDFVMNRNDLVRTVSITQVIRSESETEMKHHDLMEKRSLNLIMN